MATVYLTLAGVDNAGPKVVAPILQGDYARTETVTSSGTSAQGTLVALDGEICVKVSSPTQAIAVTTGENPTATLATGVFIASGTHEYITLRKGQKVAVIDV